MDTVAISDIVRRSLEILVILSFPFLILSLVVGLVISFLQTLTNIQEATLAFVPKIISVIALGALIGSFLFSEFRDFISEIFLAIPKIVK